MKLKSAEEWATVLLQEHERAIKQRDTYLLTGISTASHGGSHDTCFSHIIKQIQLNAFKAGMTEATLYINDTTLAQVRSTILLARDRKESL